MRTKSALLATVLMVAFFASSVYAAPSWEQLSNAGKVVWSTEIPGEFYYVDDIIPTGDTDYSVCLFSYDEGYGYDDIGVIPMHTGSDYAIHTFTLKDFFSGNEPPADAYVVALWLGSSPYNNLGESDVYYYTGKTSTTTQAPAAVTSGTIAGQQSTSKTVIAPGALNVRSGAGVSHPVIASFKNGDTVYVVETKSSWSKVLMWNGQYGWVYSPYLSNYNGTATVTPGGSTSNAKTVVAPVYLNVRSGPGVQYNILATFDRGDTAYVVETSGNWSKVQMWNGQYGWVYSSYLQ